MPTEKKAFFLEIARKIKEFGYRVFIVNDPHWYYGYFADGANIGYFQYNNSGIGFSTTTAKGSSCSGFRLKNYTDNTYCFSIRQITKQVCERAFAKVPPEYGKLDSNTKIRKNRSLEKFFKDKAWTTFIEI